MATGATATLAAPAPPPSHPTSVTSTSSSSSSSSSSVANWTQTKCRNEHHHPTEGAATKSPDDDNVQQRKEEEEGRNAQKAASSSSPSPPPAANANGGQQPSLASPTPSTTANQAPKSPANQNSIQVSRKMPTVPELKIEQNTCSDPHHHNQHHHHPGSLCGGPRATGNRTPLGGCAAGGGFSNVLITNGGIFLETPTPKIPDIIRTPTALLSSPTNLVGPKSSQLVHIDELNTPLCLNSGTPKGHHSQAFFGDHEPLLTGQRERGKGRESEVKGGNERM